MKQTLLRIQLPEDESLVSQDLRSLVASLDQPSRALFARNDDGTTVDFPGVRFIGGGRWVGVVADEAHEPVLMAHAGEILLAVSKRLKKPSGVMIETHHLDLEPLHHPLAYIARRVVLKKRSTSRLTGTSLEQAVAQRLYRDIDRTCARYGLDCPDPQTLEIGAVKILRDIGMPLCSKGKPTGQFVKLCDVSFTAHAKLTGFWFAGGLSSRGHGRISADLGALQERQLLREARA
jgi:hypothetical protein